MPPAHRKLHQAEFVAMTASIFATIAFSIDAMLPALPEIGGVLSADNPNRAALVIHSFVFGMGLGTFFTGPLSDMLGRRVVVQGGAILYIVGAIAAWLAQSLELLLVARFVQGLGSSGPRVAILAVVRDIYAGREMARIMSFVMMVFTIVPAMAPLAGAIIMDFTGWRGIFAAFMLFSAFGAIWYSLRQPETLPPENRRPITGAMIRSGVIEVFSIKSVVLAIAVQTFVFSTLFMMISTIQQTMDQIFDRADSFPLWFMGMALISGCFSLLNARVVVRVGMRALVKLSIFVQLVISTLVLCALILGLLDDPVVGFPVFMFWAVSVFSMIGLTIGNLNALAMEPLGHIAGLAASIVGAVSTIGAVTLAGPVSQQFDGTLMPLALGVFLAIGCANLLMLAMPR
ncbi:multidrug MFS transporter [Actibacterium mucosum KCTC 23349]|uniref:Multidrug MFS transporter n=1 Tax=Actibacterium mucosum KCTC 23349 TaxID=1454373 RepID=A0A037ZL33_9RHOB|nr:MFS transporter [Actibacterium mucosum]KAJ56803.1 multidrug MFS transporter [Actibacterium mucosum KCTC 23349]